MTSVKTSIALIALAAGVSACGSTASATSGKPPAAAPVANTTSAACNPNNPIPPKNQPKTPKANSCWAGNFYVGDGSLHNKKIIFADKMANYTVDQLTPQLIRNDLAKAVVAEKVLAEYATPAAISEVMNWVTPLAKAGDTLVQTEKNPKDPTGLLTNYPDVLVGGVSAIPSNSSAASNTPTQAQIGECVNHQIYMVGSNQSPLTGLNGYSGDLQWTDELVKTSVGWQVSNFSVGMKEVKSC